MVGRSTIPEAVWRSVIRPAAHYRVACSGGPAEAQSAAPVPRRAADQPVLGADRLFVLGVHDGFGDGFGGQTNGMTWRLASESAMSSCRSSSPQLSALAQCTVGDVLMLSLNVDLR